MLVLLSGLAASYGLTMAQALPTSELFEDLDLSDLSLQAGHERTFVSLNSTYIAYGVAAGAVLVLVLAVGLYLYDYYYGTSRSDPVPSTQADYSQYYTDQESYNQYLYQQAAENYRYFHGHICTYSRYSSIYYFPQYAIPMILCHITLG